MTKAITVEELRKRAKLAGEAASAILGFEQWALTPEGHEYWSRVHGNLERAMRVALREAELLEQQNDPVVARLVELRDEYKRITVTPDLLPWIGRVIDLINSLEPNDADR